ncbi:hypothetical protein NC653_028546 [Populus alba x Populus x berolinensis]|uniref:Uncharacterized protein n=1 Tax=Populus alba x Populus x berolinensis TaxID=444605 RepID=A0AAD6Q3I3_9ROSI|nr:hypothetical protein NC653_028546 [Populus alba x Populus x berolinensis]
MTLGSTWFGFKVIVVYVVTELDSSLMESETAAPNFTGHGIGEWICVFLMFLELEIF